MKDLQPNARGETGTAVDWEEVSRRLRRAHEAINDALASQPEEKRKILRARARELAQEKGEETVAGETFEVVEILLGGERYAVESSYVREVAPLKEVTRLPGTPPFLIGITNVRGRIVAVNDLRKFFGLPETHVAEGGKLVILRSDALELGVLAEGVIGVRALSPAELQPPMPAQAASGGTEYLRGVTGERVILLDAEKILGDGRMIVSEEVGA